MKLRLEKDGSRYRLVGDGINIDITEQIREELEVQRMLDASLKEYVRNEDTEQLSIARARLKATRAQLVALMGRAHAAYLAWAKGEEHGDMLKLRRQLDFLKPWLKNVE